MKWKCVRAYKKGGTLMGWVFCSGQMCTERTGNERIGNERIGNGRTGNGRAGNGRTGNERAGSDPAKKTHTWPEQNTQPIRVPPFVRLRCLCRRDEKNLNLLRQINDFLVAPTQATEAHEIKGSRIPCRSIQIPLPPVDSTSPTPLLRNAWVLVPANRYSSI